ncbi:MAG TPA: class I SAM-dependent methyltransferase [Blastocatellia bacterium]|nr:class I SAM-dependent methyltransferase [Blastocatellia bacterium]
MAGYNVKQRIIEHYDVLSPYYRSLWGEHLHHGYWESGAETKEEAQTALAALLAKTANIQPRASILDVGCGFGGSSFFLAKRYDASVIGLTISSIQAAMARQAAKNLNSTAQFLVMDADYLSFLGTFDVIWSIEAISHFANKTDFFTQVAQMLKPGGKLALIDWFKRVGLTEAEQRRYITPIERGMLVELKSLSDYSEVVDATGLEIIEARDLSERCSKTWDLSASLIKDPALWQLASAQGIQFVRFLRSFNAMRRGFASGCFVYGMIVAQKNSEI